MLSTPRASAKNTWKMTRPALAGEMLPSTTVAPINSTMALMAKVLRYRKRM
jgi:hypothetical protein